MSTKRIESNEDLASYLQQLSTELRTRGCDSEAAQTQHASLFLNGSASEFLFEAEEALKEVHRTCANVLPELEMAQVIRVLKQIRGAFDRVGGA